MTLEDHYGNPLDTSSDEARAKYVDGVNFVLSVNFGACEAFEGAVQADPEFALGHAGLARAQMIDGKMADAKGVVFELMKVGNWFDVSRRAERKKNLNFLRTELVGKKY